MSKSLADTVVHVCQTHRYFKPEAAAWLLRHVQRDDAYQAIAKDIRSDGRPVSVYEKRALGFQRNVVVGDKFVAALGEHGHEHPPSAAMLFVMTVKTMEARLRDLEGYKREEFNWGVEIISVCDDRACEAVRPLDGKKFKFAEAPLLPLPGCDSEPCMCTYLPAYD